jgi:hypothetical protein
MQNVLDLNEYGVTQLHHAEMESTDGGWVINPWAAGVLGGIVATAGYNFAVGVYEGIVEAYNEDTKKK